MKNFCIVLVAIAVNVTVLTDHLFLHHGYNPRHVKKKKHHVAHVIVAMLLGTFVALLITIIHNILHFIGITFKKLIIKLYFIYKTKISIAPFGVQNHTCRHYLSLV
jgi:hypothetical protein